MGVEWRGPVPQSNYTAGREVGVVELIVDHWMVVMFEGALRRFRNPTSRLSAHYVIGQDGRIAQLVSEDDTAYHAENYAVNLRSIGIEHEPVQQWRRPTRSTPRRRSCISIANRYGLELEVGSTVVPHREPFKG